MDLNDLDLCGIQSAGADMDLLHPGTGESLGIKLTVLGYDLEAVEAAGRDAMRTAMKSSTKPDQADVIRARRIAQARAALVGVKGATGSTKSVEDYRAKMGERGFVWIVEQIEAFAGNRGSFFRSAETP